MVLKQEKRVTFRDFTWQIIANNLIRSQLRRYSLFLPTFCSSKGTSKNSLITVQFLPHIFCSSKGIPKKALILYLLESPSGFQSDNNTFGCTDNFCNINVSHLYFYFAPRTFYSSNTAIRQVTVENYNFVNQFVEKSIFVLYMSYMYSFKFSFLNVEPSKVYSIDISSMTFLTHALKTFCRVWN